MDQGIVTTARGAKLSMHELRMKAMRPLNSNFDQKDKIQPRKEPPRQVNINGFMPSMVGVTARAPAPGVVQSATVEDDEDAPSMADLTGVIVDTPKHLKERPTDAAAAANDALKGIMQDLDQYKERKQQDAPKRRSKES